MVPDAFGPDDRVRPGVADLEAVGLGPCDAAVAIESQLLDPPLQVLPRWSADCQRAAFALLRFGAEEDVALDPVSAVHRQRLAGGIEFCPARAHDCSIHGATPVRNSSGIAAGRPSLTTTIVARVKAMVRSPWRTNCTSE